MEYYSDIKKKGIMSLAATWTDLDIVTAVTSEKEKYHVTSLICGLSKEMVQMNLLNRKRLINREQTYRGSSDEGRGS